MFFSNQTSTSKYFHMLTLSQFQSALAYLEKAMTIKNDNIECLVLKATCLINLNRFR